MDNMNLDVSSFLDGPKKNSSLSIKSRHKKLKIIGLVLAIVTFLTVLVIISGYLLLKPINSQPVEIEVVKGDSFGQIIDKLEKHHVIRQAWLTKFYFRIKGISPQIQVGSYQIPTKLSKIEDVIEIFKNKNRSVERLTFYPGATLNFRNSRTDTTPSHREVLMKLGYNEKQIDETFKNHRSHRLFEFLPTVDSLEGLVYGETYEVYKKASTESVLNKTFDQLLKIIEENQLIEAYQRHNLTLYQGIILASIVEREVYLPEDRPKVAQVFLKRYKEGTMLGSDVTYQYASRLAGVENDLYIKSPYNTRQVVGLPPTPIASPSLSSLLAVANPAATDYLYFVAGDDEKTYFAKTHAEHEQNVKQHCIKKCAVH